MARRALIRLLGFTLLIVLVLALPLAAMASPITVHFLDGMNVSDFGREVFRQWNLGDDDLLLLASAGDEECTTIAGPTLEKRFSQDSRQFLLNSYFLNDFQNEKYDAAFRGYIPQLAAALGKQYGETIPTGNLFGIPAAAATPVPTVVPPSSKF